MFAVGLSFTANIGATQLGEWSNNLNPSYFITSRWIFNFHVYYVLIRIDRWQHRPVEPRVDHFVDEAPSLTKVLSQMQLSTQKIPQRFYRVPSQQSKQ